MCAADWKDTLRTIKLPPQENQQEVKDEFLSIDDLVTVKKDSMLRELQRVLSEIEELAGEKRWDDILAIAYPVEEKFPDLCSHGLDLEVRAKVSFALGQKLRFDDAIAELKRCVEKDPENFHYHSSLAYTAYNSLYAAMNKEVFLRGKLRAERIDLACIHLRRAQTLRPEGITNFYREGMLHKKIEGKTDTSIPFFRKAIWNWEQLSEQEKQRRRQERKNYIKALYQMANSLLEMGIARKALGYIQKCISEDHETNCVSPIYKYFSLGKAHFELNEFEEAKHALLFALECAEDRPTDFATELLARIWLALEDPQKALECILSVPQKKRKPYYRWTEAEVHCTLGNFDAARNALKATIERDNRSRHKTLIRLSKIEYTRSNFKKAEEYAQQAQGFFEKRWGGILSDALFWRALCTYRLGETEKARELARELKSLNPRYPKLSLLLAKLSRQMSE